VTYKRIHVGTSHPLADTQGRAYEHHVVWVSAGNAPPGPDECIHHRDGDKANNALDNLELMTRAEHSRHHQRVRVSEKRRRRFAGWVVRDGAIVFCEERRAELQEVRG
jgi:hypothetical protein